MRTVSGCLWWYFRYTYGNMFAIEFSKLQTSRLKPNPMQSLARSEFHTPKIVKHSKGSQYANKLILITLNAKIFSSNWVCYWTVKIVRLHMTFMRLANGGTKFVKYMPDGIEHIEWKAANPCLLLSKSYLVIKEPIWFIDTSEHTYTPRGRKRHGCDCRIDAHMHLIQILAHIQFLV